MQKTNILLVEGWPEMTWMKQFFQLDHQPLSDITRVAFFCCFLQNRIHHSANSSLIAESCFSEKYLPFRSAYLIQYITREIQHCKNSKVFVSHSFSFHAVLSCFFARVMVCVMSRERNKKWKEHHLSHSVPPSCSLSHIFHLRPSIPPYLPLAHTQPITSMMAKKYLSHDRTNGKKGRVFTRKSSQLRTSTYLH